MLPELGKGSQLVFVDLTKEGGSLKNVCTWSKYAFPDVLVHGIDCKLRPKRQSEENGEDMARRMNEEFGGTAEPEPLYQLHEFRTSKTFKDLDYCLSEAEKPSKQYPTLLAGVRAVQYKNYQHGNFSEDLDSSKKVDSEAVKDFKKNLFGYVQALGKN